MRKQVSLLLLAAVGGLTGCVLRLWQLAAAYDDGTRLFQVTAPASLALFAVLAVLTAIFALAIRGGQKITDYQQAFTCPSVLYMTLVIAGGFLLLISALWGLWECFVGLTLISPVLQMLITVLDAAAAGSVILLGRGCYRGNLPQGYTLFVQLPAYAMLPWVVILYQEGSSHAQILAFVFPMLASICATLSFYAAACFPFERPRPRLCLFMGLMGVVLLLTALGDCAGPMEMVKHLALTLILLAQSYALLRNLYK